MRHAAHGPRAITAIELVAVLLVIALLATASLATFAGYHQARLVSTQARKIQQVLALARSYAISHNGYYRVVFAPNGRGFWIDKTDDQGEATQTRIVTPEATDERVRVAGIVAGSTHYTAESVSLRFYPAGTSTDASIFLIRRGADPGDDSNYPTVKLYGPTARALIFENQRLD